MKPIPVVLRQHLITNFRENQERTAVGTREVDHQPVVKLFTAAGAATWLLTELNPETDVAFGLCDLGLGFPELGYVSLEELREVRDLLGLPIERDLHFEATKTLEEYAKEAEAEGRVVA